MPLSTTRAAEIAGVERSTISKAYKNGDLVATRLNNRRLSIEESDLQDWMGRRLQTRSKASPPELPEIQAEIDGELQSVSVVRQHFERELDQVRQDRDRHVEDLKAAFQKTEEALQTRIDALQEAEAARQKELAAFHVRYEGRISDLRADRDRQIADMKAAHEQAGQRQQERIEALEAERSKAEDQARALERELAEMRSAGFFKRLFGRR